MRSQAQGVRQCWLKLPLGVDASTDEVAAHVLTENNGDDAAQMPDLLRQVRDAQPR